LGFSEQVSDGDLQDDSDSYHSIMLALEAANVGLKIMIAPDIPKQTYNEDIIEAVIDIVKFNLTHNVLVFHDPRLRQIHRPTLFDSGEAVDKGHSDWNLMGNLWVVMVAWCGGSCSILWLSLL
jgi:hypothetical protein